VVPARQQATKPARLWAGLPLAVALILSTVSLASAQHPIHKQGLAGGQVMDGGLPFEQVDPLSGNLVVSATDLVLPGNAGFDLRVRRFYNSAIYPGYPTGNLDIPEVSWAGLGWRLHFGRVINPSSSESGETHVELGDGSVHPLYTTGAFGEGWISRGMALYNRGTHTLKLPNGIRYIFGREVHLNDEIGWVRYVTEIRDRYNNWITFDYFDANGPVDGVQRIRQYLSPTEIREVTFTYHPGTLKLATMQYDGRTWQYEHDAGPGPHARLRRVRPPVGLPWEYEYSTGAPGHELQVIRTPHGGTVSYTYGDATHRTAAVTTVTRAVMSRTLGGRDIPPATWTYAYDMGANHDETHVSGLCTVVKYRFLGHGLSGDFSQATAGALAERRIEAAGSLLQQETFTYTLSEPVSPDFLPGQEGLISSNGVYTALLTKHQTTQGGETWWVDLHYRSGLGTFNDYQQPWLVEEYSQHIFQMRRTSRTFVSGFGVYLAPQVATSSTIVRTAFDQWWSPIETVTNYDMATGFVASQSVGGQWAGFQNHPDGNVAWVEDTHGHRTQFQYSGGGPWEVKTPLVTTHLGRDPAGTVNWVGINGVGRQFTYDAGFRLTSERPTGTSWITYAYDDVAGASMTVTREAATVTVHVDGFGRTTQTTSPDGVKVRTVYDACGNLTFLSAPYTSGAGTRGTTATYDGLGRLVTVTAPDTSVTQWAHGGQQTTVTDAADRVTTYEYLSFGRPGTERLVRVTEPSGAVTSYRYDTGNRLVQVDQPGVPSRVWEYDGRGLLLHETQPEAGTTTYTYDAAGNRLTRTDAAGTTTYSYDANHRVTAVDAPGTADDLAIAYDPVFGRVVTQATPAITTSYTYDTPGRITGRTDLTNGQTFASSYGYDTRDNLTSLTYPAGRVVSYHYGPTNRLTEVRQNGAVFADLFTYGDTGALASYRTGATVHTFEYDQRDRVARLTALGTGGAGLDLTYGYDAVSQVQQVVDPRPGHSQSFGYDVLGRLTQATGPWGQLGWTYDAAGNRLTETAAGSTTTYHYDPAGTQRLTGLSGAQPESFFSYNPLGQLTADTRGAYTYTAHGQLAQVTAPNVTASYTYDASGGRLVRTVNNVTTYSIRSAGGQPLSEYTTACGSTVVWTRDMVYAGGRLLGAIRANLTPPTVEHVTAAVNVPEDQGPAALSVRLTTVAGTPTTCPATVYYEAISGTAVAGADFTKVSGILTFPAGTASGATLGLTVPIINDTVHEPAETFSVLLSAVSGAVIGPVGGAVVTILDNDPAPALSVADVVLQEGHSGLTPAVFTVSLSSTTSQAVTASYATANGSATAGSDYQAASGVLTIPAGTLTTTITVMVVGDTVYEPDETFTLVLSNVVGASVAKGTATATILNDDVDNPPRLTWGDIYVPRDGAADAILWRPGTGAWHVRDSASGTFGTVGPLGGSGDIPVPADYTGDGRTDCAVFRPSTATWYIAPSCQASATYAVQYGAPGDRPVPADYDGDGRIDIAVHRNGYEWWILQSSSQTTMYVEWGLPASMVQTPHPADYDGDGRADFAIYCEACGSSYVMLSGGGGYGTGWGMANTPIMWVTGDFDGDGFTDFVYYHAPSLTWWILSAATWQGTAIGWGLTSGDIAVPADYDGDGVMDLAVYDPVSRAFYIRGSTVGPIYISTAGVSQPGDVPALRRPQ
jgi:YD repeat-containing protein